MFKSREDKLNRMFQNGSIHRKDSEGEGGTGEGEGEGATDNSLTQADVDKAVADAIAGLTTKNTELLKTNKDLKAVTKKIEGVDVDSLLSFKEQIEQNEILKLASEGKHTEAIEKATEKMQVTFNAEKENLQTELEETKQANANLNASLGKLLVDGEVQRTFHSEKGIEQGVEDVTLRANTIFRVEDGEVVARDRDGKLIQGEAGPLTIPEWVKGLKKTAPHLFPASEGGLATGGRNADGTPDDDGRLAAAKKGPAALREWKDKNRKK